MQQIVLGDLDGTLSDTGHRVHLVRGRSRDHESFFGAAGDDARVLPVIADYPHANVLLALEDRSRVVSMYRELGVTCLQVAEGDF